ncbi:MAG: hypothetical protein E7089_07045 [Bacteroidales bacterium]|nr:hypothetical protein [Bacteroidales bacterium]
MKRLLFLSLLLIQSLQYSYAQTSNVNESEFRRKMEQSFKQYKSNQTKKYNAYRDSLNKAFAEYMRKPWVKHMPSPAMPVPTVKKPIVAPIIELPQDTVKVPIDKEDNPIDVVVKPRVKPRPPLVDSVPTVKPGPVQKPVDKPQPEQKHVDRPIVENKRPPVNKKPQEIRDFKFDYYGTECFLPLDNSLRFILSNIDENSVANAWLLLSGDKYMPFVKSCIEWKERLCMCDWGYIMFVEKACNGFMGSRINESRLMQMFVLVQSGYMVRIARTGNELSLLLPSEAEIWQYPYLKIDKYKYYIFNKNKSKECYLLDFSFPKERSISLYIQEEQQFAYKSASERVLASKKYSNVKATICENLYLIDFFSSYPLNNNMDVYAECAISERVKMQLYPPLREAIKGKKESDAANILLNFVQTAFDYKTDGEQFGHEKPQFADETLYNKYCDCEDRSILYSLLVRDLLGLEVVLVDYPGHIATAVKFNDTSIVGDFYMIDGCRFFVCDPTYINANIATIMPQFKNAKAKIIKL